LGVKENVIIITFSFTKDYLSRLETAKPSLRSLNISRGYDRAGNKLHKQAESSDHLQARSGIHHTRQGFETHGITNVN
jgi:hypothetical protein